MSRSADGPAAADPMAGTGMPAFALTGADGEPVRSASYSGAPLVVFFYPRADTGTCTREAGAFTALMPDFAKAKAAVLGISDDPPRALRKFRDKRRLTVTLASDESRETIRAFGAWGEKQMYGRTFEGTLRTTFLVGADGRIARVWRNVRVDGHADEVLAALRGL